MVNRGKSRRYRLFLIDGIGAILSTFSLGYVLVFFNTYIGMPLTVLYPLATGAGGFAAYSLSCFFIKPLAPRRFFQVIGIANFTYSLVTSVLVIVFWQELTWIGIIYFVGEISILWVLAYAEIRNA